MRMLSGVCTCIFKLCVIDTRTVCNFEYFILVPMCILLCGGAVNNACNQIHRVVEQGEVVLGEAELIVSLMLALLL